MIASVRADRWLIPAFHAAIDADIRNGHDDPLNFDIKILPSSLDRVVEKLAHPEQLQASLDGLVVNEHARESAIPFAVTAIDDPPTQTGSLPAADAKNINPAVNASPPGDLHRRQSRHSKLLRTMRHRALRRQRSRTRRLTKKRLRQPNIARRVTANAAVGAIAGLMAMRAASATPFDRWSGMFRAQTMTRGITHPTCTRVMPAIQPDTAALEAIELQPEFSRHSGKGSTARLTGRIGSRQWLGHQVSERRRFIHRSVGAPPGKNVVRSGKPTGAATESKPMLWRICGGRRVDGYAGVTPPSECARSRAGP